MIYVHISHKSTRICAFSMRCSMAKSSMSFPMYILILNRYYGVDNAAIHRHPGQTGAGYPSDEEEGGSSGSNKNSTGTDNEAAEVSSSSTHPDRNSRSLRQQIAQDIEPNMLHEPVKVPRSHSVTTSCNTNFELRTPVHPYDLL